MQLCTFSYWSDLVILVDLASIKIQEITYRKIASSNTSHLKAQLGFFRLLMKGIFGPYVL